VQTLFINRENNCKLNIDESHPYRLEYLHFDSLVLCLKFLVICLSSVCLCGDLMRLFYFTTLDSNATREEDDYLKSAAGRGAL
jgi:hypothetical protein